MVRSKIGTLARTSAFFSIFYTALGFCAAFGADAQPPATRSFLEIARDKSASPAQRNTIDLLVKESGERSAEATERKLRNSPDLIFYGGEGQFVSDLSPIASFTQVETLVLYNNKISDLTPLAGLTNLRTVRLERNAISDIGPLRFLENLESLQITDNTISDIGALAGLKSLRTLWISDNKIRDISPLAGLESLRDLYLSGNPIEDLTPLTKLSASDIRLRDCGLSDISALRSLNQAIEAFIALDLSRNNISNIEPLVDLSRVSYLDLSSNQISDVSAMARSSASYLDLNNNQITDVAPLAKMRELMKLDVRNNPIRDYAPLVELQRTREGINIVADKGFEDALSKSIPLKKELQNSPLIGQWLSDPIDTSEFGTFRIELIFEANGQLTTRMKPEAPDQQWLHGDSTANPPMRTTWRQERDVIINESTGEENRFEIKADVLIFHSGDKKLALQRQVPGKRPNAAKPTMEGFRNQEQPNRSFLERR